MPLSKLFKKRNSLKSIKVPQNSTENNSGNGNEEVLKGQAKELNVINNESITKKETVEIENYQPSEDIPGNIDITEVSEKTTDHASVQQTNSNFSTNSHVGLTASGGNGVTSKDSPKNKESLGCVSVEHIGSMASCDNDISNEDNETNGKASDCAGVKQTDSNIPSKSDIGPTTSCDSNVPSKTKETTPDCSSVGKTDSTTLIESNVAPRVSCDNSNPNEDSQTKIETSDEDQTKSNIQTESNVGAMSSCNNSVSSEGIQADSFINRTTTPLKLNRSASLQEGGTESNLPKFRRKKCDSESAAYNSTDDEGFEERVIQVKEKDLEKVIGECVNKLFRESIITAVRSVTVESLRKEVMKTISSRSESESSDCPPTIEQKLHTDSVSKYVDLEPTQACKGNMSNAQMMLENEGDGIDTDLSAEKYISESSEHADHDTTKQKELPNNASKSKRLEEEILEDEGFDVTDSYKPNYTDEMEYSKEVSLDGYRADVEESVSMHSITSESSCDDLLNPSKTSDVGLNDSMSSEEGNDGSTDRRLEESGNNKNVSDVRSSANIPSLVPYEDGTGENCVKNSSRDGEVASEQLNSSSNVPDEIAVKVISEDLMLMSGDEISQPQATDFAADDELKSPAADLGDNLPERQRSTEEEKKINWKVGYLQVKLPHKSRGKGHLKQVWKKRCVSIQPDDFVNDPKNPSLMMSVYSGDSGTAKKHGACFWKSVSGQKTIVYRSNSKTHPYAFTVSEEGKAVIHLSADSETASQEWMASIRAILWPPSPVMQLEKMLNGSQFEIAIIDNDFSYRAGLLGMYGYLTITQKKLILVHPQQGYVIQEWYLNTVDKFQLMYQSRIEDGHKVLAMTTCSDSSTGKGDLLMFCCEAVTLLQSLASTIHQVLTYHSNQEGGKYQKELEEMAEWLVPSASQSDTEDYYKVPPRQVKSLLDIPNFIFNKPLTPVATIAGTEGVAMDALKPIQEESKTDPTRTSQDSGISAETCSDDVLNCSLTSFVIGGGPFPGKSSDSELSDAYTPPQSPEIHTKHQEGKLTDEFPVSIKSGLF